MGFVKGHFRNGRYVSSHYRRSNNRRPSEKTSGTKLDTDPTGCALTIILFLIGKIVHIITNSITLSILVTIVAAALMILGHTKETPKPHPPDEPPQISSEHEPQN